MDQPSTFQPRTLSDGRICCGQPYGLRSKCRLFHGISDDEYLDAQRRHNTDALRAAGTLNPTAAGAFTPPNPYTRRLAEPRAAAKTPESSFEDR